MTSAPAQGSSRSFGFEVRYDFRLVTTHQAFAPGNDALAEVLEPGPGGRARALVFVDAGLAAAEPELADRILAWFAARAGDGLQLAAAPVVVPGGEAAKADFSVPHRVAELCAEHGICRHSYVIAIGGGGLLDAVGLGASLAHRGVRLVRMPTTVLAQNDAGLGVKNGINAFGCKNFLGAFAVPHAIVNDSAFLASLPQRHWRAGIAEAIKVAIIKDADFLAWIAHRAEALAARDASAMHELIERCALLHLDHITGAGDPFERGSSRPLDFGHWAAHRLEVLSGHRLCHGEAVAIGIALDCLYATGIGRLSADQAEAIIEVIERLGFPLWDAVLELRDRSGQRSVLAGLEQFREHLGGNLTIAMPDGLGRRRDIHDFDPARFESCVQALRRRARSRLPS